MTQHIPNTGEHQIRYYWYYSNKSRGMREKALKAAVVSTPVAPLTQQQLRLRFTWAALIKLVHEVDPRNVPPRKNHNKNGAFWRRYSLRSRTEGDNCGGTMRIVGCIEDAATIEKILRHTSTALSAGCNLWEEAPSPPPPAGAAPTLDYAFFERNCV